MAQSTVSIRMDSELKQSFERLCRDVGLNLTTAFTIFAKQAVRENKISVSLEGDPFYSESNMAFLREGVAALNAGKGVEHELIEADGTIPSCKGHDED